jgi:hypothetical protein
MPSTCCGHRSKTHLVHVFTNSCHSNRQETPIPWIWMGYQPLQLKHLQWETLSSSRNTFWPVQRPAELVNGRTMCKVKPLKFLSSPTFGRPPWGRWFPQCSSLRIEFPSDWFLFELNCDVLMFHVIQSWVVEWLRWWTEASVPKTILVTKSKFAGEWKMSYLILYARNFLFVLSLSASLTVTVDFFGSLFWPFRIVSFWEVFLQASLLFLFFY